MGYVNVGYLSNPHKARSQTRYLFTCGGKVFRTDLQSNQ